MFDSEELHMFRSTLPPVDSPLVICPATCPGHGRRVASVDKLWDLAIPAGDRVPSAKSLEHHARLFGDEEVQFVAESYGISLDWSKVHLPAWTKLARKDRKGGKRLTVRGR